MRYGINQVNEDYIYFRGGVNKIVTAIREMNLDGDSLEKDVT